MNIQSQNQNFYVTSIPLNIQVLKGYKKWRKTGNNLSGAIMIGILEHFLINGQLDKIWLMIKQLQSASADQVKKMTFWIENSLKYEKGEQKLDFIMEQLKSQDPHNIFAEKYIVEYVKRVKGHVKSDNEFIEVLKQLFTIKIIVIKDDIEKKTNIKLDPKERDLIIIYNFDQSYYSIQKEAGPQLYKCLYCSKQISEDFYKMQCSQIVCYICLKRFFSKGNQSVQCKEQNCTQKITHDEYERICKQKDEKTTQLNLLIQQKADEKKKMPISSCDLCKNRMGQDVLLSPKGCTHGFCQNCLQRSLSVVPSGYNSCLQSKCSGKFLQNELEMFIRGVNNTQKNEPNKFNNQTSLLTPNGNLDATNQCEACLNYFQMSSIYISECSHKFCKICCDKEISKNVSCFQCYKANCGYKLKIADIQNFFYKKIKSQTIRDCANCQQECKIFESFQNTCQHIICYNCVKQIYTQGAIPICKSCQTQIHPNDLDEFYLPQASQEIQNIESSQQNFQQLSCSFCNSPFTDYNQQQDIPCQNHILGTCCIIFPSDCPQCQIGSLIIEKQKLKFALSQFEMENFNFASESSIK